MLRVLVNVDVAELSRAIDFYTRAFELSVRRRLGSSVAELAGANVELFLLEAPAGSSPFPGAGRERGYERHWTPVHLDFVVEALEPAVARAREAGANLESEIREYAWGRLALLSDPFGNGFCLLQFRARGYDEVVS
jgi:lactoylglutathione lyase